MDTPFIKRFYRIPRAEIGYLRFILESYDGLAFVRTLDRHEALVEVAYSPALSEDAEGLLEALASECSMAETAAPSPELYLSL